MNHPIETATPLVSVLIPAYNVERYVAEAVRAVMAQTYSNLEIIVIDDGSQDATFSVLEGLANQDKRIRLYRNEANLGLIDTLNKGLDLVTGEYIARTDADDITEPEWIETIINQLHKQPSVMAMSASLIEMPEDNSGRTVKNPYGTMIRYPLDSESIRKALLFRNPINHSSIIIRTDIFRQYGLRYDKGYLHAEDYKLWLEISKIGDLANLDKPLLYYRMHPMQVSSAKRDTQNETARKIRKEAINHYLTTSGIDFNIPEKLTYADVCRFADAIQELPEQDIWGALLYDCYLSQEHYKWRDWWHFWQNPQNTRFTWQRRLKILKKYLRPWKYGKRL